MQDNSAKGVKCPSCAGTTKIVDIMDHPRHGLKDIMYRCEWCGCRFIEEYEL